MSESDWLTERFEISRPRLRAVAYRMLGSHTEVDDAVQETWLRLARSDASSVDNLTGWLVTIVARVCLDRMRARRLRPEDLVGDDLAEEEIDIADEADPEHQALLAESVGSALLVVLDVLAPAERVAFVLHDIFAVPFDEIAPIVDRSPDAARQLASRARRRLQGTTAIPDLDLTLGGKWPKPSLPLRAQGTSTRF
jgi:RNA polymerase sigma factor (sigma-70 family)